MNKVLKIAAVLAVAASTSQARPFWELAEDGGKVTKGGMDGVWFKYDDAKEAGADGIGGCTSTNLPNPHPTCEDDLVSTPWKAMKAITYTRTADPGCTYKYPFAGIGFTFVTNTYDDGLSCHVTDGVAEYPPQKQAPEKIPESSKNGGGIKVYYSLEGEGEFTIELSTGDGPGVEPNSGITGFDEFAKALPKGNFLENGKEFYFEDFAQEGWATCCQLAGGVEEALAAASGFKFKGGMRDGYLTGGLPATATLEIRALEWIDENGSSPVLKVGGAAMANMTQAGRVLSFTGIANSAVEIINLQGALVAREAIGNAANPSINLARLPSGVYMVKVKGQSQSFTQKVMLK